MNSLLIGTSGWNYADWKNIFYPLKLPQKKWLEFYSQEFNSVEINATFYRNFNPSTYENWRNETKDSFKFTIKGPRMITHLKRLSNIRDELNTFLKNANFLKEKLSCILWQFPSSFQNKNEHLQRLSIFFKSIPKNIKHAFEFRHISWFTKEIFEMLEKNNHGFVINDSPHFPSEIFSTSSFSYVRFHGPDNLYTSKYTNKQLSAWSDRISGYLKKHDIYSYFNNDVGGFALENARTLINLLHMKSKLV